MQKGRFPKSSPLKAKTLTFLTELQTETQLRPGRYERKADLRCTDRVEELLRQLLEFLSLSLSLTHTPMHAHIRSALLFSQ